MTETIPAPLFDPFAPGFTDDPYPQYTTMREQAPVYQQAISAADGELCGVTAEMIACGALALLRYPGQLELLREPCSGG